MKNTASVTTIFLISIILALLSGCETTGSKNPGKSNASARNKSDYVWNDPGIGLSKKMTESQVKEVLGNPNKIRQLDSLPEEQGHAEIWTYYKSAVSNVTPVAADMKEIPYFNPITGEMETIQEAVYSLEYENTFEEIKVLIFNGVVMEWKHATVVKKSLE